MTVSLLCWSPSTILGCGKPLAASHAHGAAKITSLIEQTGARMPLVQLLGVDTVGKQQIALEVCAGMGLTLVRLPVERLAAWADEVSFLARLWQRETRLLPGALTVIRKRWHGHGRGLSRQILAVQRQFTDQALAEYGPNPGTMKGMKNRRALPLVASETAKTVLGVVIGNTPDASVAQTQTMGKAVDAIVTISPFSRALGEAVRSAGKTTERFVKRS